LLSWSFLFPQINTCQNTNICSTIMQTNVPIERCGMMKEQLVKMGRSRWIMLNIGKYIVFNPNLA